MAKKKITIEVDVDHYERFKKIAKFNDSSAAQEIRKFIKKYNSENANLELSI